MTIAEPKRAVIVGTSGRVGRAIHRAIANRYAVTGLDRTPCSIVDHLVDVCDTVSLTRVFEGAHVVFHVASLHAPHVGVAPDSEFARVNIDGARSVIRACRQAGVPKLVYTSTTALYGSASSDPDRCVWLDEASPPEPKTVYHRTKLEAEHMLEAEADGALKVTVLRMSGCFPEPAPLMAAYRLHRGIDARDVAAAHRMAAEVDGDPFQRFIVSGHVPFLREDQEALKTRADEVIRLRDPETAALFDRQKWALPKRIDRVYSPEAAERALGWRSRYGPREVLRQYEDMSPEVLPPSHAARITARLDP